MTTPAVAWFLIKASAGFAAILLVLRGLIAVRLWRRNQAWRGARREARQRHTWTQQHNRGRHENPQHHHRV